MDRFGRMLKRLLRLKGKKQYQVAQEIGVSTESVSLWVRGKRLPTLDNAANLAKALGVSVDVLASYLESEEK